MSIVHLIGLLIVVGIVLALVPIDPTIRKWVVILVLVLAAIVLLSAFGLWPF